MNTALAILDERYVEAADRLSEIGHLPDEAYTRLLAAGQYARARRHSETSRELEQALAFYRSIGATRYVREGEALLPASA